MEIRKGMEWKKGKEGKERGKEENEQRKGIEPRIREKERGKEN